MNILNNNENNWNTELTIARIYEWWLPLEFWYNWFLNVLHSEPVIDSAFNSRVIPWYCKQIDYSSDNDSL